MNRGMAAAALLLVAGGALAQATLDEAREALTRCYARATMQMDDGLSDARTIAAAALEPCRDERRAAMRLAAPSADAALIERAMRDRDTALDHATRIVLQTRIERKKRAP